MKHLWITEYSPTHDKMGMYPWHIQTLREHLEDNLRELKSGNGFVNDWFMIGGPFKSNADAGDYLDRLRASMGWKWKER